MKYFHFLFFLIFGLPVYAQTPPQIYDLDKAQFSWTWSQGTGGPAVGFRIKCGNAPKNYPMVTAIPDNTARIFPVKTVVGGSGNYYCVIVAFNAGSESTPSGEYFFGVTLSVLSPGNFTVTEGVTATQTKAGAKTKAKK